MCGIAGVLRPADAPPERSMLEAMAERLSHRGPDSTAVHIDGGLGLAHTRLAVLDLSRHAEQPMLAPGRALSYNGEIYNYRELRAELERDGLRFEGTGDTEVLFAALRRWGVEPTLERLEGMFAFAWCDTERGTVHLCRDRFGVKPLYWTAAAEGFLWGSEIKALAAATPLAIDPVRSLFGLAGMGDALPEATLFEGVRQVPPGHRLLLETGQPPRLVRYFDLTTLFDAALYRELDRAPRHEIVRRVTTRLDAAVERMLASDVPIGVFASGGVDSSLIAASALRVEPRIALFTSDVGGPLSELDAARRVADHLGLPLHVSEFARADMLSDWALATWHYECPIVTHTNALPFARVAALARRHGVKPVLTGEGADELFMGYPTTVVERYRRWARLPLRVLRRLYGPVPGLAALAFPEMERSIKDFIYSLVRGYEGERIRARLDDCLSTVPEHLRGAQAMSFRMLEEGLLALLHRNDRMGMLASIESRFPYLDEPLVGLALSLPARHKRRTTWRMHNLKHPFVLDKYPLRALARERLPVAIAHRVKRGFPMYGHGHVAVKPGYFSGGFLAERLHLTGAKEAWLLAHESAYFVAKLVSLEVFGEIFDQGRAIDEVGERLGRYVELTGPS